MTPTHVYTGPTTVWGLQQDTRCIIFGKGRSGLVLTKTPDAKTWQVGRGQLRKLG